MTTQDSKGLRAIFARKSGSRRHDAPPRMRYLEDARMRREMGHL